jgi:hypothetical protein
MPSESQEIRRFMPGSRQKNRQLAYFSAHLKLPNGFMKPIPMKLQTSVPLSFTHLKKLIWRRITKTLNRNTCNWNKSLPI